MTDTEIAWLAGLLEGEGSFLFAPPSAYKAAVGVNMQMTDEDVIARAAKLTGVSYGRYVSPRNENWKPVFILAIRGRRAVHIMNTILPYMGERRTEKILQVLKSIEHIPKNKFQSKITKEMGETIFKNHRSGFSARKISRNLGLHHSAVCRYINTHV